MALTHAFQEAVADKNIRKIRIMLEDSLLTDPSFELFKEMERAALSVEGLYDKHDGRTFVENPEEWDDSYMSKIMVQVVGNFSHERVDHLKEVVRKLRPVSDNMKKTNDSVSRIKERELTYDEQKKRDQENGRYKSTKIAKYAIVGGMVVGSVATAGAVISEAVTTDATVAGVIAGKAVATSAIVGTAVAGAAVGVAIGAAIGYKQVEREKEKKI